MKFGLRFRRAGEPHVCHNRCGDHDEDGDRFGRLLRDAEGGANQHGDIVREKSNKNNHQRTKEIISAQREASDHWRFFRLHL